MKESTNLINLDDVDLSGIIGRPMPDSGIIRLVKALYVLDYMTIGSCEGHLDGINHPFPWISVYGLVLEGPIQRSIQEIINAYNQTSDVKWIHKVSAMRTVQEAKTTNELMLLQQSAEGLVQFLLDNYLEKRIL